MDGLTVVRDETIIVLKKDMFELASRQKEEKLQLERKIDVLGQRLSTLSDLHMSLNDSLNRRMSYAFMCCGFALSFALTILFMR